MLTGDWWLYPIEQNAVQRVAVVSGGVRAVFPVRGTSSVWAVGDGGLVAHSTDAGRTWSYRKNLSRPRQSSAPKAAAASMAVEEGRADAFGAHELASRSVERAARSRDRGTLPRLVNVARPVRLPQQQQQQQQQEGLVIVPNVVGLSVGAASAALTRAGLTYRTVDTVMSSEKPGVVVRQSPLPGDTVKRGSDIRLFVSALPSVTGYQQPSGAQNPPANLTRQTRSDSTGRSVRQSGSDTAGRSPPTRDTSSAGQGTPPAVSRDSVFPRLLDVCFADSVRGWVVGEHGSLFATTDGEHWAPVETGATTDFEKVVCDASGATMVLGRNGQVLRGGDGSWRDQSPSSPTREVVLLPNGMVWAITAATPTGTPVASSLPGSVVRSIDSGRSWPPANVPPPGLAWTVAFVDVRNGFIGTPAGVLVTRDSGTTWRPAGCRFRVSVASTPGDTTPPGIRSIAPVSATHAIAVDDRHHTWSTADGWQTCAPGVTFATGDLKVVGASADRWYTVAEGTLLQGDASGRWSPIIGAARFSSLAFADDEHGYAGLPNGWVARTSNGGETWEPRVVDPERLARVSHLMARTRREVYATMTGDAEGDAVYQSVDGGASWSRYASGVTPIVFSDSLTGWGQRADTIYVTRNGGGRWTRDPTYAPLQSFKAVGPLIRVVPARDTAKPQRLWGLSASHRLMSFVDTSWVPLQPAPVALTAVVPVTGGLAFGLDSLGALVRSTDAGNQWTLVTGTPRKFPAPWYYVFAALCVLGTVAVVQWDERRTRPPAERSVADILVSDRPLREGDRDILDFGKIAGGLSRFLRNTRTQPPLTIAITGPWGTGKSSLMHLLRRDLARRSFRTVWFNAWHHQREDALLASLLESVRQIAVPPVWTVKGARFRVRLLWARFSRYAIPLLLLLPVFAWAVGYIVQEPQKRLHDLSDAFWSIRDFFTHDATRDVVPNATPVSREAPEKTLLALVVSIAGAAVTYLRGLKAFGVNPGDLVKSVTAAGKPRTQQSAPAFRERFAQDFREVTNALKPERLVVFIDDLDRCKPEQVLEILEAVNFLVESGDCVVILGIDRERVTGCVAIGFKDVASVLAGMEQRPSRQAVQTLLAKQVAGGAGTPALRLAPDTPAPAPSPLAGSLGEKPVSDRELQIDYARHYLEKLLNMEIPIPEATADGLGKVMTNPVDEAPPRQSLGVRARRYRVPMLGLAAGIATVATFYVGYRGAGSGRPIADSAVTPPTADAVASNASSGANAQARPDTLLPAVSDSAMARSAMPLLPASIPETGWWQHALVLAIATATLVWLLTPRERNPVHDSDDFSDALRAWAPVLFEEFRTPRAAKKFLNHVRFLAMAQRAPVPAQAPAARALDALKRLPGLRNFFYRPDLRDDDEPLLPGALPEPVLVSLSVIAERYPEWLEDETFWNTSLDRYVKSRLETVPEDLQQALDELKKPDQTANTAPLGARPLPSFSGYREAWKKLTAWVQTD